MQSEEADRMLQQVLDDYVIIDKEAAVEAMASFIASYIARLPQASKYDPKRLQEALQNTFTVGTLVLRLLWDRNWY